MKTAQTAQIVDFPKERIVRIPLPEDMKAQQLVNHRRVLDMIVVEESGDLAMKLMMAGINVTNPNFQKSFALTMEFLRASLYASADLQHGLQPVMEKISNKMQPGPIQLPEMEEEEDLPEPA